MTLTDYTLGMAWWNRISETERRAALAAAHTTLPAEAWKHRQREPKARDFWLQAGQICEEMRPPGWVSLRALLEGTVSKTYKLINGLFQPRNPDDHARFSGEQRVVFAADYDALRSDWAKTIQANAEVASVNYDLNQRIRELEAALTPSAETKAAYMGEFTLDFPEMGEDGEERMRRINVPWTTIKTIMAAIHARACSPLSDATQDRGDEP